MKFRKKKFSRITIRYYLEMYPSFEAGVAFAPKVRRAGYVTIFDLFQLKFGKNMGAVLFFNELFANIFWEAAILGALGRD